MRKLSDNKRKVIQGVKEQSEKRGFPTMPKKSSKKNK